MDNNPKSIIIASIIFTLVAVSGVSILSIIYGQIGFRSESDYTDLKNLNATFNNYNKIVAATDGLQANVEGATENSGFFAKTFGFIDGLISKAWNGLSLFFNSFGFIKDSIFGLSKFIEIPSFVTVLVYSIIIVIVVFSIYSAIFKTT